MVIYAQGSAEQAEYLDKTAELVTFLRLHGMLSNRHPDAMALDLSEREAIAIYSITETLFHEILPGKTEMIQSIFTGEGEHLHIPFEGSARMLLRPRSWFFLRLAYKRNPRSLFAASAAAGEAHSDA